MATMFQAFITCLTGVEPETSTATISDEKHTPLTPHQPHTAEEVAEREDTRLWHANGTLTSDLLNESANN